MKHLLIPGLRFIFFKKILLVLLLCYFSSYHKYLNKILFNSNLSGNFPSGGIQERAIFAITAVILTFLLLVSTEFYTCYDRVSFKFNLNHILTLSKIHTHLSSENMPKQKKFQQFLRHLFRIVSCKFNSLNLNSLDRGELSMQPLPQRNFSLTIYRSLVGK